jgi:hypothetical protein
MKRPNDPYTPDMFGKFFGTQAFKLVRRRDPNTSKVAAVLVDSTKLEQLVFEAIRSFGGAGCISDQVRDRYPNYPYSSITARYRALLDKGFIIDTGERRPGKSKRPQRVMRATQSTN